MRKGWVEDRMKERLSSHAYYMIESLCFGSSCRYKIDNFIIVGILRVYLGVQLLACVHSSLNMQAIVS